MANFTITAHNIYEQFNADVINLSQVQRLTQDERKQLLNELLAELNAHVERNAPQPAGTKLMQRTKSLAQDISSASPEQRKQTIADYLTFLKSSLGSTADIVVSAVKIAQLLGM